jgi:hypothetical protein
MSRREKTIRSRPSANLLLTFRRSAASALIACALIIVLVNVLANFAALNRARQAEAETLPAGADEKHDAYLCLAGPNDGELIIGRAIRLSFETNCPDPGKLGVSINGTLITKYILSKTGFRDAKGVLHGSIDLDLVVASQLTGTQLLHPDAPPVRVDFDLRSTKIQGALSVSWVGYVGKPWMELGPSSLQEKSPGIGALPDDLPRDGLKPAAAALDQNLAVTPAVPEATLHPMKKDIFFMVVASTSRDLLVLPPDDTRLLREARVVAFGAVPSTANAGSKLTVSLEPLAGAGWQTTFVVLWTFNSDGVWTRSVISPLAR